MPSDELKALRTQWEALVATFCDEKMDKGVAMEMRIAARETCLKLYKENLDNANFWKAQYQSLMCVEDKPAKTPALTKITPISTDSPQLPPY